MNRRHVVACSLVFFAAVLGLGRSTAHAGPAARLDDGYDSPQAAAVAGVVVDLAAAFPTLPDVVSPCPDNPQASLVGQCFTFTGETDGSDAAVLRGGTVGCDASGDCSAAELWVYVVEDAAGWHYWDAIASQNRGAPDVRTDGDSPYINDLMANGSAGTCPAVSTAPARGAEIVTCVPAQSVVRLDNGPLFADGQLWWHIAGTLDHEGGAFAPSPQGWMAHASLGFARLGQQ
jgi:hypothetical protein